MQTRDLSPVMAIPLGFFALSIVLRMVLLVGPLCSEFFYRIFGGQWAESLAFIGMPVTWILANITGVFAILKSGNRRGAAIFVFTVSLLTLLFLLPAYNH